MGTGIVAMVGALLVHPRLGIARPLTRRAFACLALWGAAGLSLVSGCGSHGRAPPRPDVEPAPSLLDRWAELGRLWRAMTNSAWRALYPSPDSLEALQALRVDLVAALDALTAWPELRALCGERWEHQVELIPRPPTCYVPMASAHWVRPPGYVIEDQVKALDSLVARAVVTRTSALRAARILGIQAERILGQRRDDDPADPGPPAFLAGKRLAELTIDELGYLAGPPQEDEGVPDDRTD